MAWDASYSRYTQEELWEFAEQIHGLTGRYPFTSEDRMTCDVAFFSIFDEAGSPIYKFIPPCPVRCRAHELRFQSLWEVTSYDRTESRGQGGTMEEAWTAIQLRELKEK